MEGASRDIRCVYCGGPFWAPRLASRSWHQRADDDDAANATEDDYTGIDSAFFERQELLWLTVLQFIGFNSTSASIEGQAFYSGTGVLVPMVGGCLVSRGDDPLAPDIPSEDRPDEGYSYETAQWKGPDPFRSLSFEIILEIASYLRTTDIFRLVQASPKTLSVLRGSRSFWIEHINTWHTCHYELRKDISKNSPTVQNADLMHTAFRLAQVVECDPGAALWLRNRRRVWSCVQQILAEYKPKWEAKNRMMYELDLKDPVVMHIKSTARCDRTFLVAHEANLRGRTRDMQQGVWVCSKEDLCGPRTFTAIYDATTKGLLGLSLLSTGQRRLLGRCELEDIPSTISGHTYNLDGSSKLVNRFYPSWRTRLCKTCVTIGPDKTIVGLVLHMVAVDSATHAFTRKPGRHGSYIVTKIDDTQPSVFIRGITIMLADGESIRMDSGNSLPNSKRRYCCRALLPPSGDHMSRRHIVGLSGQLGGEAGEEQISRLGILHAPFTPPATSSALSGDEKPDDDLDDEPNRLATLLWKSSSTHVRGRRIWDCHDWLRLDFPETEVQERLAGKMFHDDTVGKERLLWATSPDELSDLKRVSGWFRLASQPPIEVPGLPMPDEAYEPRFEMCGLRAQFHNRDTDVVVGSLEAGGSSWPEEELVHFDVDGPGGERISEVGLAVTSCYGTSSTLILRTNWDREMFFERPAEECRGQVSFIETTGSHIVGLVLGFGRSGGWTVTIDRVDDDGIGVERVNATHSKMTYLATLTSDFPNHS